MALDPKELPANLINAIESQSAVLFLGAGANAGALHPKGDKIPGGDQLRDLLAERFLNGQLKNKQLSAVAEYAIGETSLVTVQQFIRDLLKEFHPAGHHLLLARFRWHGIATTNYDLLMEEVFDSKNAPLQELVPFVKNGQPVETQMKKAVHGLQYLKLHGSIDHYLDQEIPLILAAEQYARYSKNRTRLFERFRDWGTEFPLIFCGYSVSDPNIQTILFDLFDLQRTRPMYYVVDPGMGDIEARYWSSHRITPIRATFEEFLTTLDVAVSATSRALPKAIGGGTTTLRPHYKVTAAPETKSLLSFLEDDVEHIRHGMPVAAPNPRDFYRGLDVGWGAIERGLDVPRAVTDSLVVDAILSSEDERSASVELYAVKGPAGNGKTIVLKRAAWMAAHDYNKVVLFLKPGATIRSDALEEIYRYTQERIFLFVDKAAFHVDEIHGAIRAAMTQDIKLTIIVAERDAEWNVRCESLDKYGVQDYPVRYLSEAEIRGLLGRLEKFDSLGLLKEIPEFEDRVKRLLNIAQRQLLVALHEATLGQGFEDIVFEEYHRIVPTDAQILYLDICTLNRLGVSVRAGLILRISGFNFNDFQSRFFKPLEHIVHAYQDKYIGDYVYSARHQHVAEMVFDRVLSEPDQRYNQVIRIMAGMNLDYTSDQVAFSQLVRGHTVSEALHSRELGRAFFEAASKIAPRESFLFQQRGIYEMEPGGDLKLADEHLSKAHDLDPRNKSIQHSLAVLNRRYALESRDSLLRKRYRDRARALLTSIIGMGAETPHGYHTSAQIALDELKDILNGLESTASAQMRDRRIVELAADFERYLQEGLQKFPLDERLLAVEAEYRQVVDQSAMAEMVLKKAFAANPRQDWLAIRLAKTLERSGKATEARDVLAKCLEVNPTSKRAHFELAMIYSGLDHDRYRDLISDHLRLSFTLGDRNYEAQFWYAREAFLMGNFADATKVFRGLRTAQIWTDLKTRVRGTIVETSGKARVYVAEIVTVEDVYLFARCADFPENIFVHRSRSADGEWDRFRPGKKVTMTIGFNMRGPTAASIQLLN